VLVQFSVLHPQTKAVAEEFEVDVSDGRERLADYGVEWADLANGVQFEFGPEEAAEFASDFGVEVSTPAGYCGSLVKQ
jgi:hypothetical protein